MDQDGGAERMALEVAFLGITRNMQKRVLLCAPSLVEDVRRIVASYGLEDTLEVRGSVNVPEGGAYLVDEQAVKASFEEALQHWRPNLS